MATFKSQFMLLSFQLILLLTHRLIKFSDFILNDLSFETVRGLKSHTEHGTVMGCLQKFYLFCTLFFPGVKTACA